MSTTLEIDNSSPITGEVEVYPLFDINPPNFQMPGNDTQPVDLACVGADLYPDTGATILAFPIGTYEMRSHPVNVQHWVLVDVDKDGTDDYMVRNEDLGDGRWVAVQYDLSDPDDPGSIYFFLDSSLNSNMMVLLLVVFDEITSFNFKVESYDAYFGDDDGLILLWDQSPLDGGYHSYDATLPKFVIADNDYFPAVGPASTHDSYVSALPGVGSQIGMLYRHFNGVNEYDCVPMSADDISNIYLPVINK